MWAQCSAQWLSKVRARFAFFYSPSISQDFPENLLGNPESGKSKRGLSKGGLGPKGANWAKKGPFGAISALPSWLWGAEASVPIGPEKAPIGPEKVPIWPEKARFSRKDFSRFSLKPGGLSPPFGFSQQKSMPNMTGRPGSRTMEMIGGSSVSYLARTPCAPLFSTLFNKGWKQKGF